MLHNVERLLMVGVALREVQARDHPCIQYNVVQLVHLLGVELLRGGLSGGELGDGFDSSMDDFTPGVHLAGRRRGSSHCTDQGL